METFTSTIVYKDDFKTINRTGWGCGYVHIPKDHPILVQLLIHDGYNNYLSIDECPEEITWSAWDKKQEYYVIGFDTAHIYNNDSHDEQYVTNKANDIKDLVDCYTAENASNFALNIISETVNKFNKYLL